MHMPIKYSLGQLCGRPENLKLLNFAVYVNLARQARSSLHSVQSAFLYSHNMDSDGLPRSCVMEGSLIATSCQQMPDAANSRQFKWTQSSMSNECSIMRRYASRNNFPIVGISQSEPIGIMSLCLVSHTTDILRPINASAVSF
jgi:hypothetical protein